MQLFSKNRKSVSENCLDGSYAAVDVVLASVAPVAEVIANGVLLDVVVSRMPEGASKLLLIVVEATWC